MTINNSRFLLRKCVYCGKPQVKEVVPFCSKQCETTYKEKIKQWEEQGLCTWGCGRPVYVDKNNHKYRACYDCLKDLRSAFDEIDKFERIARGEINNGK